MTVPRSRRLLFLAVVLMLGFTACQKDLAAVAQTEYAFTPTELADINADTCLTQEPTKTYYELGANLAEAADRTSALKNKCWTPGQTIRVLFLNGSTTLQNRTFAAAAVHQPRRHRQHAMPRAGFTDQ